ncbi:hypothetical protein TNCT_548251 [Trichonephila clavata]|uniref:Uncharacterized protein n=1 Tax=Trichonephila clavata TaxID=2740835 RepID=A0A8X6K8Z1_TRICU|nr:hypothetical protein TNCT_548251 [Trichonephila clavata]
MLHAVDQNPGNSVRVISVATRRSRTADKRILQEEALHSFHVQKVLLLQPDDHSRRVALAQWFVNQSAAGMPVTC